MRSIRRIAIVAALVLFVALSATPQRPAAGKLAGYSEADAQQQRDWEQKFRAIPQPANMREYMQHLAARPHHVGSPYDQENAQWLLSTFKSWGLDSHIETFDVLFPTPKERLLEMTAPVRFTAKLEEPAVPQDPTSNQKAEQLPTYNAYSADGDVTGPLVYVNYGIPADYDALERMGVSVKGAIVIARYGQSWRGIKPKVAAEHGAVGCIIYSDPRDDGYFAGDTYPNGAYRPNEGVQRGSVEDMPLYPGDPLTPGVGATKDAKRLPLNEVKVFTKIPVLPISYGDAQPLLEHLTGPMAPREWRGGLPIAYHVGPGVSTVHLVMKSNWDRKPVNDVITTIPGSEYPNEWIVRGNHHDGWVNGAQDPISGQVAEMEELRAYSELLKQGWKPKRTIIYASWDGEEPGLLGSTEWGEAHAQDLQQHAVVYINSDSNSRGYFGAEGSHSLQTFINDVARDVTDPETNLSVWKRLQLRSIREAKTPLERAELRKDGPLRIDALGSGSDYTVFIDHLGIASLDLGYGGEAGGGIYHSIYDDFYWYTHFDDPQFAYGRALAQTTGTAVMRLADADVLPFNFADLSATVARYVDELQKLASSRRDDAIERNRELDEGVFSATADPTKKSVPPARAKVPPFVNFAPLLNALGQLQQASQRYETAFRQAQTPNPEANAKIMQSERALMSDQGLPGRPWFRHEIYAPGFYTGYGVKTIPAVREAIEQDKWDLAEQQIALVAKVLENEASVIDEAAAALEKK